MKQKFYYPLFFILIVSALLNQVHAVDIAILQNQQMSENKAAHNAAVVTRALEITEEEYGPFEVKVADMTMSNARLHKFVVEGEVFNTVVVIANQLWDDTTIGIKVPVRLGLLSYRLLLVNKLQLTKFEKVKTKEGLGKLYAGLAKGWETGKVFNYHGFNVKETGHFEGIFAMLDKQRFDYLPRGVYEVYDELESRSELLKHVVVEPTLALYIPTVSRVYVSPKHPRLAKRIETGLQVMLKNGDLKEILYKYYKKDLERADLKNRRIITVENPLYDINDLSYKDSLLKFSHVSSN